MACGCGCKGAQGGYGDSRPNGKEVLVLSGTKLRSNPSPVAEFFTPATTTLLGGLVVIGASIWALKRVGS